MLRRIGTPFDSLQLQVLFLVSATFLSPALFCPNLGGLMVWRKSTFWPENCVQRTFNRLTLPRRNYTSPKTMVTNGAPAVAC